jgi:hypothetical protein
MRGKLVGYARLGNIVTTVLEDSDGAREGGERRLSLKPQMD